MNVERDNEGCPLPHHKEDEEPGIDTRVLGVGKVDKFYPIRKKTHIAPEGVRTVNIKFSRPSGKTPTKGTIGAAAYDVYATESVKLLPGETVIMPLGFSVEIPPGYDMKVTPRSGLSRKGLTITNSPGLIDEDYRGQLGVLLRYDPANTYVVIEKLYKALGNFCKNLVSSAQFNLDLAKQKLADAVNVKPFKPFEINAGDRIGQIQIHKVVPFIFKEVENLSDTERGSGGYGSTDA